LGQLGKDHHPFRKIDVAQGIGGSGIGNGDPADSVGMELPSGAQKGLLDFSGVAEDADLPEGEGISPAFAAMGPQHPGLPLLLT